MDPKLEERAVKKRRIQTIFSFACIVLGSGVAMILLREAELFKAKKLTKEELLVIGTAKDVLVYVAYTTVLTTKKGGFLCC